MGRALTSSGFDDDDGRADPTLLAALKGSGDNTAAGDTVLMRAVADARLLVPVVVAPTAAGSGLGDGVYSRGEPIVEKSTDMAVVVLTSPSGERALPVFSSLATLLAWDAAARPIPVSSSGAAQSAVTERCDVILLDLGSGHEHILRPSMVWALAQQRDWLPAHTDPFVAQAISRATVGEPDVIEWSCEEGDPCDAGILRVVLRLRPGLEPARVQALATRVGELIATDGETRARIDGLTFAIRQA